MAIGSAVAFRWTVCRDEAFFECQRSGQLGRDVRNWVIAQTRLFVKHLEGLFDDSPRAPNGRTRVFLIAEGEDKMSQYVAIMERVVRDLDGNIVGCIEAPAEGPFRLRLLPPWEDIADSINRDIDAGASLPAPNRTSLSVKGTSEAELEAVVHSLRVLSERKLRVTVEHTTRPDR